MGAVQAEEKIQKLVTAPILCIKIHNFIRLASGFHQIPQKNSFHEIFGIIQLFGTPKEFH